MLCLFCLFEGHQPNSDKREKRPPYTFKSGAIYDGEWKGNMRDGYGEQKWLDGARYEGMCCVVCYNIICKIIIHKWFLLYFPGEW